MNIGCAGAWRRFAGTLALLGTTLVAAAPPLPGGVASRPTPPTLAGAKVLTAAELQDLLAAGEALLVDVRNPLNFGRGHLPGAISMPVRTEADGAALRLRSGFSAARLDAGRGRTIVFYSHGADGWKAYVAAGTALRAGYARVAWFRGGVDEWEAHGGRLER